MLQENNEAHCSVYTPHTIANAFNEYFLSLAQRKCVNVDYDDDSGNDSSSNWDNNDNTYLCTPVLYLLNYFNNFFPNIKWKCTPTWEIENIIKSLKPKNTYGYNCTHTNLLKISLVSISSPLSHTSNMSLSSGIFLQCFKYSVVKPLYEKSERNCIYNYRAVSLMTSFSKVFEKAMYNRLLGHLMITTVMVRKGKEYRWTCSPLASPTWRSPVVHKNTILSNNNIYYKEK